MTPDELRRAGAAIADRIDHLHTTATAVAAEAGIHPSTLRAIIHGRRWPQDSTRSRINQALGWPHGHLSRLAVAATPVEDISDAELARILYDRLRNARCA